MTNTIKVLFFGALAEQVQTNELHVACPTEPLTLDSLKQQLAAKGERWQAISETRTLCAVNQALTKYDCSLNPGDEVAFFPPVTGG